MSKGDETLSKTGSKHVVDQNNDNLKHKSDLKRKKTSLSGKDLSIISKDESDDEEIPKKIRKNRSAPYEIYPSEEADTSNSYSLKKEPSNRNNDKNSLKQLLSSIHNINVEKFTRKKIEPQKSINSITNINSIQNDAEKCLIKLNLEIFFNKQSLLLVSNNNFQNLVSLLKLDYVMPDENKMIEILQSRADGLRKEIKDKISKLNFYSLSFQKWASDNFISVYLWFIEYDEDEPIRKSICLSVQRKNENKDTHEIIKFVQDEFDLKMEKISSITCSHENLAQYNINLPNYICISHFFQSVLGRVFNMIARKSNHITNILNNAISKCRQMSKLILNDQNLRKYLDEKGGFEIVPNDLIEDLYNWRSIYKILRIVYETNGLLTAYFSENDHENISFTQAEFDDLSNFLDLLIPFDQTFQLINDDFLPSSILIPSLKHIEFFMNSKQNSSILTDSLLVFFKEEILRYNMELRKDNSTVLFLYLCSFFDPAYKNFKFIEKSIRDKCYKNVERVLFEIFNSSDLLVDLRQTIQYDILARNKKKIKPLKNEVRSSIEQAKETKIKRLVFDFDDAEEEDLNEILLNSLQNEIKIYLLDKNLDATALTFWHSNRQAYPILSKISEQFYLSSATCMSLNLLDSQKNFVKYKNSRSNDFENYEMCIQQLLFLKENFEII
jgi:hypothetical protein